MFKATLSAAIALTLVACGGGNNGGIEAATGVLEAGRINGLRYATATQSGVMGADGSFRYVAGETVRFSLGAIEFGTATGAPAISLFTLAGLTPPTTEYSLRRELDRATRRATPFVRAMNLQRLLMALDSDGDTSNGFDVGGRHESLATVKLDLGLGPYPFADQLDRFIPDITRRIPLGRPIVELYRGVGVAVPGHAPVSYQTTDSFGSHDLSSLTYYSNGALESEVSDDFVDGVIDSSAHYTYDATGRMSSYRLTRTFGFFGLPGEERRAYWEHDARGQLREYIEETDFDLDGTVDTRLVQTPVFDEFGRVPTSVATYDTNDDGVVDVRERFTNTYDTRGNLVAAEWTTDVGDDAVIESRYFNRTEFDAQGRPESFVYEADVNADGIIDDRSRQTYSYETVGRYRRVVYEYDFDANGNAGSWQANNYRYDSAGNMVERIDEFDIDADGVLEQTRRVSGEFDSLGRLLHEVERYLGSDGAAIATKTREQTFDGAGNLLSREDISDDSFSRARFRSTHDYGDGGELLRSRNTSDYDGDGDADYENETVVVNAGFANAALLLSQKYFGYGN